LLFESAIERRLGFVSHFGRDLRDAQTFLLEQIRGELETAGKGTA
jgi:hypothetical protein